MTTFKQKIAGYGSILLNLQTQFFDEVIQEVVGRTGVKIVNHKEIQRTYKTFNSFTINLELKFHKATVYLRVSLDTIANGWDNGWIVKPGEVMSDDYIKNGSVVIATFDGLNACRPQVEAKVDEALDMTDLFTKLEQLYYKVYLPEITKLKRMKLKET